MANSKVTRSDRREMSTPFSFVFINMFLAGAMFGALFAGPVVVIIVALGFAVVGLITEYLFRYHTKKFREKLGWLNAMPKREQHHPLKPSSFQLSFDMRLMIGISGGLALIGIVSMLPMAVVPILAWTLAALTLALIVVAARKPKFLYCLGPALASCFIAIIISLTVSLPLATTSIICGSLFLIVSLAYPLIAKGIQGLYDPESLGEPGAEAFFAKDQTYQQQLLQESTWDLMFPAKLMFGIGAGATLGWALATLFFPQVGFWVGLSIGLGLGFVLPFGHLALRRLWPDVFEHKVANQHIDPNHRWRETTDRFKFPLLMRIFIGMVGGCSLSAAIMLTFAPTMLATGVAWGILAATLAAVALPFVNAGLQYLATAIKPVYNVDQEPVQQGVLIFPWFKRLCLGSAIGFSAGMIVSLLLTGTMLAPWALVGAISIAIFNMLQPTVSGWWKVTATHALDATAAKHNEEEEDNEDNEDNDDDNNDKLEEDHELTIPQLPGFIRCFVGIIGGGTAGAVFGLPATLAFGAFTVKAGALTSGFMISPVGAAIGISLMLLVDYKQTHPALMFLAGALLASSIAFLVMGPLTALSFSTMAIVAGSAGLVGVTVVLMPWAFKSIRVYKQLDDDAESVTADGLEQPLAKDEKGEEDELMEGAYRDPRKAGNTAKTEKASIATNNRFAFGSHG